MNRIDIDLDKSSVSLPTCLVMTENRLYCPEGAEP